MNIHDFRKGVGATLAAYPKSRYLKYLMDLESPDLSSVIMVEIPSFKDPELIPTIKSHLGMAANPDRIRFAVCLQDDDADTIRYLDEMCGKAFVKHYHPEDSPGACAARYECSKLSKGNCDYVLHTDSHMRVARYWDVAMLAILSQCPGKAVLSAYGMDYADYLAEDPCSDLFTAKVQDRGVITNAYYYQEKMPKIRAMARTRFDGPLPRRGAFLGAAFLFGPVSVDDEVPFDPDMFFQGDELPMALRLFTHGWDIYHPQFRFQYHLYSRQQVLKKAGTMIEMNAGNDIKHEKLGHESARFDALFWRGGIDFGRFGNGDARTVDEFMSFAGIDVRNMAIRNFAMSGFFDVPHDANDMAMFNWCAYARKQHLKLGPAEEIPFLEDAGLQARFFAFCDDNGIIPEIGLQRAMELFIEAYGSSERFPDGRDIVLVGENAVSRGFMVARGLAPHDAIAGCIPSLAGIASDSKGLPEHVPLLRVSDLRHLHRPLVLLCTNRWKEARSAVEALAGEGYHEFEDVLQWHLYRRRIAIRWGNCHADYVADFLSRSRDFSETYAFYMMPSLWNLKSEADIPEGLLERVELCIGQPVRNDNSIGPFASLGYVSAHVPTDTVVLTFANLRGLTLPLYVQFPQSLHDLLSTAYSRVPVQNFSWFRDSIIESFLSGHPDSGIDALFAAYMDADVDADSAASAYEERCASYRAVEDEQCTLKIFDFIDGHMATEQLFIDPEHPSHILLNEIGNRVLDRLGMPRIYPFRPVMSSYGHGCPMHPAVKRRMGYTWADMDIKGMNPAEKPDGSCMDIKGYVKAYIDVRREFLKP